MKPLIEIGVVVLAYGQLDRAAVSIDYFDIAAVKGTGDIHVESSTLVVGRRIQLWGDFFRWKGGDFATIGCNFALTKLKKHGTEFDTVLSPFPGCTHYDYCSLKFPVSDPWRLLTARPDHKCVIPHCQK
ncbi:hypothetical protein GCM10027180_12060 [Microbulbifer echini]